MKQGYIPGKTLGIIGGGQLGRMMLPEARRLGLKTAVYTASPDDPAVGGCDIFVQGSLTDADGIAAFAEQCDYLTIEIEHVALEGLRRAETSGCTVFPPADALQTVQDKLAQRRCFAGLPQPEYAELPDFTPDDEPGWRQRVVAAAEQFGYPVVQKTRRGGYDGRGVAVLRSEQDVFDRNGRLLLGDSYLEAFVPLHKELGVIVARSASGEIKAFPVTEMRFDPDANICTSVAFPARIESTLAGEGVRIARQAAERLKVVGLLAVELFVSENGDVVLNEVAPRPHNSGHLSIEACETSQFEQHIRAVLGLPLGSTGLISPAAMRNLLGAADGTIGRTRVSGLDAALAVPGARVHLYGKQECRPNRKMGHVTALAPTLAEARERAVRAASAIRITGEK